MRCVQRVTMAALAVFAWSAVNASAQNPFQIDGVVPDAGVATILDPHGNVKELGPVNGSITKIGTVNAAQPAMLELSNPNGQVDLGTVYLGTYQALNGDQWLYFGWQRPDSNSGSGFISIEFQQSGLPSGCSYTGVDFTTKSDTETAALVAECNPWRFRRTGDFIITWDQQGNGLATDDIKKRTFACTGSGPAYACTLGEIETLGTVVAAVSDDRYSGEMAVNLTTEVFGVATSCLSFANVIPGTVTGNSDTADYKDTVFAPFTPVTNCGVLKVRKVTLAPDNTAYADPANPAFGYTVTKSGDLLRYSTDATKYPVDGAAPQIQIVRPNSNTPAGPSLVNGTAATHTHLDLIPGTNYTLVEATPPAPYQLLSIICYDGTVGGKNITTGGTFKVAVPNGLAYTECVVTNRIVKATPVVGTTQSYAVRLNDSTSITGITPGAPTPPTTVTFRLYSDNTCTTQVGSAVVADLAYNAAGTAATANTFASGGILVSVTAGTTTTFYWRVSYAGDLLNNGVTTACGHETTTLLIGVNNSGGS